MRIGRESASWMRPWSVSAARLQPRQLEDIASAARLTKRTLYYHFASKDALLTAV